MYLATWISDLRHTSFSSFALAGQSIFGVLGNLMSGFFTLIFCEVIPQNSVKSLFIADGISIVKIHQIF